MQDETTIYCWTHRRMRLDERIQPYVFQAGFFFFLYISCLEHIKLDHGLIHALIDPVV
jgi:hypothetical protein